MERVEVSDHASQLRSNFLDLISRLRPRLFLERLSKDLSPDVLISVRGLPTDEEQADKLVTALLTADSPSWYKAFFLAIGGLYPDLFQQLTSRDPHYCEDLWYIQPLRQNLKRCVLEKPSATNALLGVTVDMKYHYVSPHLILHDCQYDRLPRRKQLPPRLAEYDALPCQQAQADHPTQHLSETDLLKGAGSGGVLLLYGRAGVGKSTLVHRLTWLWADDEWGDRYSLVFALNMRKLVLFQNSIGLASFLQEYTEFPAHSELPEEGVAMWLDKNSEKLLVFLDGMDELSQFQSLLQNVPKCPTVHSQTTPLNWAINLLRKDVLHKCCVVITSRPSTELNCLNPTREVEMAGLTEDGVKEYIRRNVGKIHRPRVHDIIYTNPFLLSVCTITFYCAAMCKIFEKTELDWTYSQTTYTRITEYIIRNLAATGCPSQLSQLVPKYVRDSLPHLENLAFSGLPMSETGDPKLFFDADDLSAVGLSDDDLKNAERSGLLTVHQKTGKLGLLVQFIHRHVQDFLAMRKLLRCPHGQLESYLKRHTKHIDMNMMFLYGLGLDCDLCNYLQFEIDQANAKLLLRHAHECRTEERMHLAKLLHESQRQDLVEELAGSTLNGGELCLREQMTAIDMRALHFVLKNSQELQKVSLLGSTLDDASAEQLGMIVRDADSLQKVVLTGTNMTERAFVSVIGSMYESQSLSHLGVDTVTINQGNPTGSWSPPLTDQSMLCLSRAIKTCDQLKELRLQHQEISSRGAQHLAVAIHDLSHLKLMAVHLEADGWQLVAKGIATSRELKTLWWWADTLQAGCMESLAAGIKKSRSLSNVTFSSMTLNQPDCKHLGGAIRHSPELMHLTLEDIRCEDGGWGHVCDGIKKSPSLRHLSLSRVDLNHQDWAHLSEALKSSRNLSHVELGTRIAFDKEASRLLYNGVMGSRTLRDLSVKAEHVSDMPPRPLSRLVRRLHSFKVNGNLVESTKECVIV